MKLTLPIGWTEPSSLNVVNGASNINPVALMPCAFRTFRVWVLRAAPRECPQT